jgi:Helix-turn-helix domain
VSIRCIRWAVDASKNTSPAAQAVLFTLANFANNSGLAWPGTTRLAKITRLSSRTVHRAIKELVRCGDIVSVTRGGGRRTNRYLLHCIAAIETGEGHGRLRLNADGETDQQCHPDAAATSECPLTTVTETDDPSGNRDLIDQGSPTGPRQGNVMPRSSDASVDARFRRFWAAYPRKDAQSRALAVWTRLAPDDRTTDKIIRAVQRRAATKQWADVTYVPFAARYLEEAQWKDMPVRTVASTSDRQTGTVPDCDQTSRYLAKLRSGKP